MTQISNHQVDWFTVYLFVASLLARSPSWPAAGTYEWVALADDDPRKLAAVLEAGCHWSLKVDAEQCAQSQVSHDISSAEDWRQLAIDVRNHKNHRIKRKASS